MGILDDAIREHLELKRSHGASEDEVRRKEAEVFGSVRQEQAAPTADEHTQLLTQPGAPETHVAEPARPDVDALQPAPEDPYEVHEDDHAQPDPGAHEDVHADRTEHATRPVEAFFDTEHAAEAGAGMLEPHEVDPGPPSRPEQHYKQPTEEHPALADYDRIHQEEHPPEPVFRRTEPEPLENPDLDEPPPRQSYEPAHEEDPREGDDGEQLLEETPEFLQDAPEHDRLWFEQKPPRDFDFGE
jgi:hypothetical protein